MSNTFPHIVPSGTDIIPYLSGFSNIGTIPNPFSGINAVNISGANVFASNEVYSNVISGTTISGNSITALTEVFSPVISGTTISGNNITALTELFSPVISGTTISGNSISANTISTTSTITANSTIQSTSGNLQGNNFLVGTGVNATGNNITLGLQGRSFSTSGTGANFFYGSPNPTVTNGSGSFVGVNITPNISQSGSANFTILQIDPLISATGSGSHFLFDAQVSGTSKFNIDFSGNVIGVGTINSPILSGTTISGNIITALTELYSPIISGTTINSNLHNSSIISGTTISGINTYSNQYATPWISGNYSAASGSITVNWNQGSSQLLNFSGLGAVTCAITLSNGLVGSTYALQTINNAASGIQVSWANSPRILWPAQTSGTMTSGASAVDLFAFFYNGTTYLGSSTNNYK